MIVDFYLSFEYWLPVIFLSFLCTRFVKARMFDYDFFALLLLTQYIVHSALVFGLFNVFTVFCGIFLVCYLTFRKYKIHLREFGLNTFNHNGFASNIEPAWILISKYYLLIYFSARIFFYPFHFGELLLDDRLSAQHENKLLFFLGLVTTPAIAVFVYFLTLNTSRLSALDFLISAITLIGLLGFGSKAVLAPIVFAYISALSYQSKPILSSYSIIIFLIIIFSGTLYVLGIYFPALSYSSIFNLILYRLASNTDSLEYIFSLNIDPGEYPYGGVIGLFPYIFKLLGFAYDYSPGVWLHGLRYDNWDGYGPNPGIFMDYFGNFRWVGLIFAPLFGFFMLRLKCAKNSIGFAFMSILPIAFTDFPMYSIALIFWSLVLIALYFVILFKKSLLKE